MMKAAIACAGCWGVVRMVDGVNGAQSMIDKRFPPTSVVAKRILIGYPAAVLVGWLLGLFGHEWAWWVAAFCFAGWAGALFTHVTNTLHREGYSMAISDLSGPHN